jgi:hypothetical protein
MKLFNWISTHNNKSEGGRKCHIMQEDKIIALCGYSNLFTVGCEVDLKWINQPDPDNNLCERCKKMAMKILINR